MNKPHGKNISTCRDSRQCRFRDYMYRCTCLVETYPDGKCPFIKGLKLEKNDVKAQNAIKAE